MGVYLLMGFRKVRDEFKRDEFKKYAEFGSTCESCGERIEPGDEIAYSDFFDAWVHEGCGD